MMNYFSKRRRSFVILLLFLSLLLFSYQIYPYSKIYFEKYDHVKYEQKFLKSQWRVPQSKNVISDEDLYTYAAYEYVRGANPILINPETPHLGKYLIGLSIILFNNQRVMSLFIALFSLVFIYRIILMKTKSDLSASIAVFLVILNTTFVDQLIHSPQLDIYQLMFFLMTSFFFLKFSKSKKKSDIFLAGIFYGSMLSTKFFFQTLILTTLLFAIFSLITYKSKFIWVKKFVLLNIVGFLIYTLSNLAFFLHGGTIRGFLGMQKWILVLYKSTSIDLSRIMGGYLGLIFINKYRFWSDGYPVVSYQSWSIFWPIIFLCGMILAIFYLIRKGSDKTEVFFSIWILIYAIFLIFVPIFPRYLLMLFIPQIILIVFYVDKYIINKKNT